MMPPLPEFFVATHIDRLKLIDGLVEAPGVHECLGMANPIGDGRRRAILESESNLFFERINCGDPGFEGRMLGFVGTVELHVEVGEQSEEHDPIGDPVSSAGEPGELFGGDLGLPDLHRTMSRQRPVPSGRLCVERGDSQQRRARFLTLPTAGCGTRPAPHRVGSHRFGQRRWCRRQCIHRVAGPTDGE
jgi:hypothetical protein